MRFLDLGTLEIDIEGRRAVLGGKRPGRVLSALLMHVNRRVSVELLMDAVWGESRSEGASGTLESHVWRLRRMLEPDRAPGRPATVLVNESAGYRLNVPVESVDSARFEQLCLLVVDLLSTGQPDRALGSADEALRLWRGAPFDDIADRDWASGPVARLRELQAQLLERRVDCILACGQPARAVAELESLMAQDSLRERLWWQRMLALYRLGRVEHALDTYQQARSALLDELGIEPGGELIELHRRMLNRDPGLDLAPPERAAVVPVRVAEVQLPRERRLIAREQELEAVTTVLRPAGLVTIAGPAGCGKTRLAIEAARAAASGYPDGVWFVDLSDAETIDEVAVAVTERLRLTVPPGSTPEEALVAFGRDRRMLLVLDNCEQALDAVASLVEDLLGADRHVCVLTTSREPIEVDGEVVHQLVPLAIVGTGYGEIPAVALLLERIGRTSHPLTDADRNVMERICRAVDGIPLAIELAAALVPTYGLDETAQLVERDPGRLGAIGRGMARHHRTLFSAIDRSYRLLSEDEQVMYRRLSVLPPGFSREVAEALAPGEPGQASVAGLLARLSHRSMLAVSASATAEARFHQLVPIRAHAANLLAGLGETDQVEDLRDAWTRSLIERRPRSGRPGERDWYGSVESNLATVRATLHRHLLTRPDELGAFVAPRLFGYWYYHGLIDEGRRWAEAATAVSRTPAAALQNQASLTSFLVIRGLIDQAVSGLEAALAAHPVRGDEGPVLAELLLVAAGHFAGAGAGEPARRSFAEAERLTRAGDDPDLEVLADVLRVLVGSLTAPPELTLERAEQAYDQALKVGNLLAGWLACSGINTAALRLEDPLVGLGCCGRLLSLQLQLSGQVLPHQLETYANFLAMDGQWEAAVGAFAASYHRARRAGASFPRNPLSRDALARCRASLAVADFDRAWAGGPATGWSGLLLPVASKSEPLASAAWDEASSDG